MNLSFTTMYIAFMEITEWTLFMIVPQFSSPMHCTDEQPYLLFGSFKRIIRADLDGRNNRTIINQTAVGLDYDYR